MYFRVLILMIVGCASLMSKDGRAEEDRVDYLKQIKPVLRERCFGCHGALKQEADLRLDTVALMSAGGDSGAVFTPGDASASLLVARVAATEVEERMPPEHEGEPLSSAQIALLRTWIEQGTVAPADEEPEADPQDHWAFLPIVRPEVLTLESSQWISNPVDAFLAVQHQQQCLTPQPEASRVIQLRRLYLDLIGIPPTAKEITAFENDQSSEGYKKVVEFLLADQRHGERWGRHWMDVWRYSDWWGLNKQLRKSQKHIWHWRDWIVESLNDDMPYDEMVRLMLAADELHPTDFDKLRATGYLARNYFLFNRNQWMDETVEHVSKSFVGLTMNCAKCHDHKYDPIEQADYYRLRAFFEPYHVRLNMVPDEPDLVRDGIPSVFDGLLDEPTYLFVRGDENKPDKSVAISPGIPDILAFKELVIEPITLPAEAWQPELRPWVIEAYLAAANKHLDSAETAVDAAKEKLTAAEKCKSELLARLSQQEETSTEELDASKPETPPTEPALGTTSEAAEAAIDGALAELKVAEADVVVADAARTSIDRRADAMRAEQVVAANHTDDNVKATTLVEAARETAAVAIRAERHLAVTKAKHEVAVAEVALRRAVAESKPQTPAEKDLKKAHKSLEKATADAEAEVKPTDQYTPLQGAQWTPTRFFDSTKDDPTVQFVPQSTGRRTALADWITDRRNPLTARVAANHIWMRHMGAPLVPTVFDFGRNGTPPTHPELLDWLAVELIDSGWSMKHLHRLIVNSSAYRMSSSVAGGEANVAKDADNRYWWRRTPMRLESQVVRDSILAHAGTLDPMMGGPPVLPKNQATSTRRSLYYFHSNNQRNLFLTMFDEAMVIECYRREQSIVPQQALALTNSQLVLDASKTIAPRLTIETEDDPTFIRKAFTVMLGIAASDAEIETSCQALEAWRQLPEVSNNDARAHFVWALINHNDFVTLR